MKVFKKNITLLVAALLSAVFMTGCTKQAEGSCWTVLGVRKWRSLGAMLR